jgi:hypothetical protein
VPAQGYRLGDATVEDGILQVLPDSFNSDHMGVTARTSLLNSR